MSTSSCAQSFRRDTPPPRALVRAAVLSPCILEDAIGRQAIFTLVFMVVLNWRLAATCFVVVPAIVWASKVHSKIQLQSYSY